MNINNNNKITIPIFLSCVCFKIDLFMMEQYLCNPSCNLPDRIRQLVDILRGFLGFDCFASGSNARFGDDFTIYMINLNR